LDALKHAFLAKEWNTFHLKGKRLGHLHLKGLFQLRMWIVLESTLDTTQRKIVVAIDTSSHIVDIEIGWWWTIPTPRDNKLYHFCSYNIVENKTHFVLKCPFYNSVGDKTILYYMM
jgi:hypothetical protein